MLVVLSFGREIWQVYIRRHKMFIYLDLIVSLGALILMKYSEKRGFLGTNVLLIVDQIGKSHFFKTI